MRLLIVTQTIDARDSRLGFFTNWVKQLAPHFKNITVFALKVGTYELPGNVQVFPTRPWNYRARVRTALNFLSLAWKHRKEYDAVFVHQNQEYVLVAGWLWKLLGKKVFMWRNHYEGNFLTNIAASFCDEIFYTSNSSYTAKYKKAKRMPVGVDVESAHLEESIWRNPHTILFLARFDRSKRPHLLVEALAILKKKGISFSATFVGGPIETDPKYPEEVKARAAELELANDTQFVGAVANTETYRYYRAHDIFVNLGKSGMFDKTMFKAVACGVLPLSSSGDMADLTGPTWNYKDGDVEDLARVLTHALALSEDERSREVARLAGTLLKPHSLPMLVEALVQEITSA